MPLLADGLNSRHALRSWATLIRWLPPTSSMLSIHLLLGLPLTHFPSLGVHSDVILAHLGRLLLERIPYDACSVGTDPVILFKGLIIVINYSYRIHHGMRALRPTRNLVWQFNQYVSALLHSTHLYLVDMCWSRVVISWCGCTDHDTTLKFLWQTESVCGVLTSPEGGSDTTLG